MTLWTGNPTVARRAMVAGFSSVMQEFIDAYPGKLVRHFRSPVESEKDMPYTYLDARPESIAHSAGLRDRVLGPSIVLVTRLTEAGETSDLHDELVDLLVDHFTANPHIATGTVWGAMTVANESAGTDNQFAATRFSFPDYTVKEGRD